MQLLISGAAHAAMQSAPKPTAEQLTQLYGMFGSAEAQTGRLVEPNASRVMTVVNDTAQIDIVGVMTTAPDWGAMFFGGGNVLFGDLLAAISSIDADDTITQADFFFNSPGGEAMPTAALGDAIGAMKTKTRSLVDVAASAAYWAASQADSVVANSRASLLGSIGVVTGAMKPSEERHVEVTSTKAPNKRPNPETAEGITAIREQIDPMHDMFVDAVAAGRGTTADDVNTNFGRGGMLLADAALKAGMIDSITAVQTARTTKPTTKPTTTKLGAKIMDLAKLKTDHPAVYALAVAEGEQIGLDKERDRVKFHATMGANTGATEVALRACLAGTSTTDGAASAEYMTAGINNRELGDREADNEHTEGKPAAVSEEARETARVTNIFANAGNVALDAGA